MQFTDSVAISGTKRTSEGYLIANARSVRTGIQDYLGSEVGKPELPIVSIYRPPESVFSRDSLQSFSHAPVTNDHPSVPVTSDNWKELAVGEVSTAALPDGQWVSLPLILKDAATIKMVEAGKRQLSAGYTSELVWEDGVTPEGQRYQAKQTNIRANHLALVDAARAGPDARIGDSAPTGWGAAPILNDMEKDKMATRTIHIDGLPIETTDAGAAVIAKLQKDADSLKAIISDAEKKAKEVEEENEKKLAKKDAEIDALRAKVLDDAALDARVRERSGLIDAARKIAKDVKTDGLSDAAIKKAAVAAKLGDAAIVGKTEAYIDARFDILAEDAVKQPSPYQQIANQGIVQQDASAQLADTAKAHAEMVNRYNK